MKRNDIENYWEKDIELFQNKAKYVEELLDYLISQPRKKEISFYYKGKWLQAKQLFIDDKPENDTKT